MKKVLIANRGEVALRIVRACRTLNLPTVAVHSDIDADAPHVQAADEAISLGGSSAAQSYLLIEKIIAAAAQSGADAVHPGYGFLSESAAFARAAEEAGLNFIGPSAATLELLGNKHSARELARSLGVPVIPGMEQATESLDSLITATENIGFPLMIKAVAGGGGKGMRRVREASELPEALAAAAREATAAFGDGRLILERLLEHPRHIEVQVAGDSFGNIAQLFERDCSSQRRFQKVIEEGPAPNLHHALRQQLLDAATKIACAAKLRCLATVEFLVLGQNFFFLECNPRLQVEHGVTEIITGIDLVSLQIRLAAGEALPAELQRTQHCGHAIEARVYAENPFQGFLPSSGQLLALHLPQDEHLRVEAALTVGRSVETEFDPLLLKLLAQGPNRTVALERLLAGLERVALLGVSTNVSFLLAYLRQHVQNGSEIHTTSISEFLEHFGTSSAAERSRRALACFLCLQFAERTEQFSLSRPLQTRSSEQMLNLYQPRREFDVHLQTLGETLRISSQVRSLQRSESGRITVNVEIDQCLVEVSGAQPPQARSFWFDCSIGEQPRPHFVLPRRVGPCTETAILYAEGLSFDISPARLSEQQSTANASLQIRSPLPGCVIAVHVQSGQTVQEGDALLTLESMKMEHLVRSPRQGVMKNVFVRPGDKVSNQTLLLEFVDP